MPQQKIPASQPSHATTEAGPKPPGASRGSHDGENLGILAVGTSAEESSVNRQGSRPSGEISEVEDGWQKASDAVWKQAYDQFANEQKPLSEFYERFIAADADCTPDSDIKTQMNSVVERQQKHMEERQWTFRAWGSSKPRKMRDAIDGIFTMTKQASSLISFGMTFAPVYVSLPWSAIAALIPFIMNDTAQQNGAIQGIQDITRIIHGYNIAERTYLQHGDPKIRERFADAVLELYVSVLTYQTRVAQYFGGKTIVNLLKNTLQQGIVWKDESSVVASRDKEAQRNLSFLGPALVEDFFHGQNQSYELLLRSLSNQRDRDDEVLKWLSPNSPFEGHFKVQKDLGQRYISSNQWVLSLQEYKDWKVSIGQILWLEGGVGTGKSSITFSIIEDLMRSPSGNLAFFYCSKSTGVDQDLTVNIVRSLIRQCAKTADGESLKSPIREFYEDNKSRNPEKCELGVEECFEQLTELINLSDQTTLVIDALDECKDLEDLLSNIRKLWDQAKGKLRVFVTSRYGHADTVRDEFHNANRLEILDRNSGDIDEYLRLEIPTKVEGRRVGNAMTDEQAERLKGMLRGRAQGMFLWVTLQVGVFLPQDRRARPKTVGDVKSKLESLEASAANLPESLNKVYDQVYEIAIGPPDQTRRKAMVDTALKWVLCSYRPITLSELAYAAAIGPDGVLSEDIKKSLDVLLEVCSNLLTEDPSGFMRPSHLSVKEYLEHRKPITGNIGEFESRLCHAQAALTCLHFKSLAAFHEGFKGLSTPHEFAARDINEIGFPTYAITYWPKHYLDALQDDELSQLLIKYLKSQPGGLERLQILGLDRNDSSLQATTEIIIPDSVHGLEVKLRKAASLGWEDEVEALIALGADLYAQNEFGDTVLHEAVDWGQARIVEIVLGNAAIRNPDLLNITNRTGNTACHKAMFWGKREVVQIITDHVPSFTLNINSMSASDVAILEEAEQGISAVSSESSQISKVLDIVPFKASGSLIFDNGRYIYEETNHVASSSSIEFTSGSFCGRCNLAAWLKNPSCGFYHRHHKTYANLVNSALSGCELCSLFTREFGRKGYYFHDGSELSSYVSVRLSLSRVPWSSSGSRDLLTVLVGENAKVVLELYVDRATPDIENTLGGIGWDISGRSIATSSSSETCFDLVQTWFKECEKNHVLCGQNQASTLPKRVLCIEDALEGEEPYLRLHTTRAERGRYVFLSYMWGSGDLVQKTTRFNFNDLSRRIPIHDLPRSWQDAIIIVRKMGIRYLWIDALCIIQDSVEDWNREASLMGHYVLDATMVLAAGFARSTYNGLFLPRRDEDLAKFCYTEQGRSNEPNSGVLRIRRPLQETREAILQTPLARRGWAMQEAVLPERLLYYGSEQLYWNCQTHALSEGSTFPEIPIWKLASHLRSIAKQPKSAFSPVFLNTWYELVEEYSAKVLTYGSDKLVAFGAIAGIFQKNGGDYIAGLWKNDFHRGLLWKVERPMRGPCQDYRAPSWSWASSDDLIQYELAKGIRLPVEAQSSATILEVNVDHISENIFGRVTTGFLILEGLVQEITADLRSSSCSYHFDSETALGSWEANGAFTCVLIARWSLGLTDIGSRWVGLILLKVDNHMDSYRRVGLLNGPAYEEDMLGWERRILRIL